MRPNPIKSFDNLRERVTRLLSAKKNDLDNHFQLSFDLPNAYTIPDESYNPKNSINSFLNFICDCIPNGELYLFGGVLRDLALLGKRGFNSDIDLVVHGQWDNCVSYLESLNAKKNKFGGFRLEVAGWPIDIWNAEETWAFRQGLVQYQGISSLTKTTVLNWDAILMNWRTQVFIHRQNYLSDIQERTLDIVLEENPNHLGMAVRVFRHFCLKDAKRITSRTASYMSDCTGNYQLVDLTDAEIRSYGNSVISPYVYRLFEQFRSINEEDFITRYNLASKTIENEIRLL